MLTDLALDRDFRPPPAFCDEDMGYRVITLGTVHLSSSDPKDGCAVQSLGILFSTEVLSFMPIPSTDTMHRFGLYTT